MANRYTFTNAFQSAKEIYSAILNEQNGSFNHNQKRYQNLLTYAMHIACSKNPKERMFFNNWLYELTSKILDDISQNNYQMTAEQFNQIKNHIKAIPAVADEQRIINYYLLLRTKAISGLQQGVNPDFVTKLKNLSGYMRNRVCSDILQTEGAILRITLSDMQQSASQSNPVPTRGC